MAHSVGYLLCKTTATAIATGEVAGSDEIDGNGLTVVLMKSQPHRDGTEVDRARDSDGGDIGVEDY